MQSVGEIMAESGIDNLRIVFRFELSFIDANQFLSFPGFFPETIVGDPIEPGREPRLAAETAEILVGADEGFLRQIVRERNIAADELAEQTPDAGLVVAHQFGERVVVILKKNPGDKVCIGKRHARMLGQGRGFVFRSFKLPNQ